MDNHADTYCSGENVPKNIIIVGGVYCVYITTRIYITSKYTNLYRCYCVGTQFRGGVNPGVLERFMAWKQKGKINDKPKPIPKVWDTNMI